MSTTNCTSATLLDQPIASPRPKIDIQKALKLRLQNKLSFSEIAIQLGCTKQGVQQALSRFNSLLIEPEELEAFEESKPQILSSLEMRLLQKFVDEETLQKASLNNAAYAYSQIFQANRLTRNQSTENVNVLQINADLEHIQRRKSEILKQLGSVGNNTGTEVATLDVVGNGSGEELKKKAVKVGKRKQTSSGNVH